MARGLLAGGTWQPTRRRPAAPEVTSGRRPRRSECIGCARRRPPMPAEVGAGALPLQLSNPDKVLFPKPGYTKRALAEYYVAMSDVLLPFVRDRPLMLKSYPNGVEGRFFFRQDAP